MSNKIMPQPPIIIPDSVPSADCHTRVLSNKIKFHTINNSSEGVIRLSLVFKAGSSMQSVAFCASAAANLLSEGSERFTAAQIAEKLDFIGSYFDVSVDRDYCVITFCTLKKFLAQTLEIIEQVITKPTFPESEIRTYCQKRKDRIAIERTKVSFKARELFARSLFGENHPYGVSSPESKYNDLRREDIVDFYKKHYCAENCFAVSSGDLDDKSVELMSLILEQISSYAAPLEPDFEAVSSTAYAFLEHKDALQSAIRIGLPFFTRSHPHYIPMQVACTVLGGYFGSRLVKVLREKMGYTYGVFSALVNLEKAGYMAIATEVADHASEHSVELIFEQIELLRTEKISEQELQMVKNIVIGEIMRIMDGPFGVVDVTIENLQNKQENNYLDFFIKTVRELTPEKILEITQKYWIKENFTTVVVGGAGS